MLKKLMVTAALITFSSISASTPQTIGWILLAKGTDRAYYVLEESIRHNISSKSVQFAMKVEYNKPVQLSKKPGDVMVMSVETTLVLCDVNKIISTAHIGVNPAGEYVVDDENAQVYDNPKSQKQVLTHIFDFACEDQKKHINKKTI